MRILILLLVSIIAVSCATHKQTVLVPIELPSNSYHYDSKVRNIIVLDSVSRWADNDTVYIYREKTKILNISDTLISRDSISSAVMLEQVDELNIEYLNKLSELKSLIFKMLSL